MGVVYFSIIPTFEPSRYYKCWIVCFYYRNEVIDYIGRMDANSLLNLCKDINEWKYKTGTLNPDCTLKHLAENLQYWELRDLETMILDAAYEKFEDIVSLLIKNNVGRFFK